MPWIIPLVSAGVSAYGAYKAGQSNDENQAANRDLTDKGLQQTAAVQGANFNRQNPGIQMTNSVRGDLLSGLQPAKATGSGRNLQISGGLNPGLLSDNSRQLGALTSRQALLAAMGQQDSQGNIGGVRNPYASPFPDPNAASRTGPQTQEAQIQAQRDAAAKAIQQGMDTARTLR